MSVSASAQENVLSETWGQKLDLTIPSSEMPSTWVLDSKDKHAIIMGLTRCYRNELITSVQTEHSRSLTEYMSKGKVRRSLSTLRLVEPPSHIDWTIFVGLQVADVYTTYRGLKYDCVYELNPIVGESPSVDRMVLTKATILIPALHLDIRRGNLNDRVFDELNFLMAMVVLNNYGVYKKAKRNCNKL